MSQSKRTDVEAERLEQLVAGFAGKRIVVLGDLVADEFIYGDISRISREAPVLVLEHRRTISALGGGGNSVANLHALGARPIPVGIVGRDEPGKRLIARLKDHRIPASGVLSVAGYPTPTKTRVLAGGIHTRRQQIVRIDHGAAPVEHPAPTRSRLRRALETALRRADGLLVADYGYGAASPRFVAPLRSRLDRLGLPLTVDSRTRVTEFGGVTACTPNQEEVEQALNLETLDTERSVVDAGRRLLRKTGDRAVLMTRGARGMSLFERGKRPVHVPAYGSDEVADVTGAGDTVIAAFTLALVAGATFGEASRLANYAAGLVVTKAGTATVDARELIGAIREDRKR